MKKERLLIFYLGLLPFVMVLGNSMLIPILPDIRRSLNLSGFETGLILSMFSIPAAIIIPFIGFLSDRWGRRLMILLSLLFVITGSFICGLSGLIPSNRISFSVLLTGRIIQGIGAAGTTPLAMALVGDIFTDNRSKVLGVLEVYNGAGKLVAPVLGALAALKSWYLAFYLFPVTAAISYWGIKKHVPKAKSGKDFFSINEYTIKILKTFNKKRNFLFPLYLSGGVSMFVMFGILYYLSFLIEETYQIDGFFKGVTYMFPLGAMTIVSYWTGKRLKTCREELNGLLFLGNILMVGCFIALILFHSFSFLLFFITLAFGSMGFILPSINMAVTSSVPDSERGFVVSLYGTFRFLGVALGPVVFENWMDEDERIFIYPALILLASFFYFVFSNRREYFSLIQSLRPGQR
ncbi:MFS transporter [Bacillus methanolicus]|uniref:Major facilitator family transporter n=1 Tax=Bacillus methanolicus (strain MGA3 / ATCC 53907) TaxID=796606 RepID=I3EAJ5_BACMM|nr:MFS transporter [Bacillus methanolicus]AIE60755.1 major facilitator family transporter [Bacillus methanolicus MGA3]EIJ83516.1 major facilitator family transporter [Bacillus methanolicus MGA3]